MDGNEIEPEEEELVTESETTLTEVDYGLLMLFIGQFILNPLLIVFENLFYVHLLIYVYDQFSQLV